jgi:hypothetical protein
MAQAKFGRSVLGTFETSRLTDGHKNDHSTAIAFEPTETVDSTESLRVDVYMDSIPEMSRYPMVGCCPLEHRTIR